MILTCPACGTRYAVKEGAIPPGGRQVRCASCKHSWHQNPEDDGSSAIAPEEQAVAEPNEQAPETSIDEAQSGVVQEEIAETADPDAHPLPEQEAAAIDDGERVPFVTSDTNGWSEPETAPDPQPEKPVVHDQVAAEPEPVLPPDPQPTYAAEQQDGGWAASDQRHEIDFQDYASDYDEDPPRGRGLLWLVIALLLIAAAVAAFWFLAPPEWKQRLGVAEVADTPLVVQLDETNRRTLASGNELLEVTGKVINPTDQPQRVPQIEAMLRSYEQKVVYRWTIPPPATTLAPGGSATFNSAELLTVPADARCLSVSAIDAGAKQLEPCTPQSQQVAPQEG